jgi:formylglycine-generating enzyme required for sulfatase activity
MPPTLFISHSSQDAAWCRPFVAALRAAGYSCFFDEDSIPGSAAWVASIERGVQSCDLFMLILTPAAWISQWVQDERQLAQARRKPFLTVQHIDTPGVDGFLTIRQWINVVGLEPAAAALRTLAELARLEPAPDASAPPLVQVLPAASQIPLPSRLARLGFQGYVVSGVEVIVPPVCDVPSGTFTMGSDKQHDPHAYENEIPQYDIFVPAFQIGTYPLTVAEYACAVRVGAVKEPQTIDIPRNVDWAVPGSRSTSLSWQVQQQWPAHPIVCITWLDVKAYAAWLTQVTHQPWRLPTEAEWEKAARGTNGRIYPWGDEWDKTKANTSEGGPGMTTSVGNYADKDDASPYGVHDMAGNVWEWTNSLYQEHPPYRAEQAENDADTTSNRVLRGDSWGGYPQYARAATRAAYDPSKTYDNIGVRLVRGSVVVGT